MNKFGAHMSIAGGYDRAVYAAKKAGMRTVQLFTKSNNQWRAKPLTDDDVANFHAALRTTGIVDPVAHNSYLINLASPDDVLWRKSIDAMTIEVERAEALGITDLVAHPGAHVGQGEAAGVKRIVRALDQVHRSTRGLRVRIDLETTAGQGTCLGHRFEHLQRILERAKEPERLGICLDTCHLFAAGYALAEPEGYNQMTGDLERCVGVSRVRVWHLNDSAKPRGSRVDRHAAIGRGQMGLEAFRRVVNDPRFAALPMILETPKGIEGGIDLDVINLRVLKRLVARPRSASARRHRPSREGGL